jgi:hypothetical protein
MRALVIACARAEALITYGELAARMTVIAPHPGAYVFQALLREMCREEEQAGRGMLCALVVSKASGMPGAGFFKALIHAGEDCSDQQQCWQKYVQQVYDYWRDADLE